MRSFIGWSGGGCGERDGGGGGGVDDGGGGGGGVTVLTMWNFDVWNFL